MTETDTAASSPSSFAAAPSIGAALRSLRESQGLTPEAVSSRIKFSPRQIVALEEERWADLPTGVSLRGLVRGYARLVGADETALAAIIAPYAGVQPVRPDNAALRGSRRPVVADEATGGVSWGWLIVLLLFVAAGATYAFWQGWLPSKWLPGGGAATEAPAGVVAPAAGQSTPGPAAIGSSAPGAPSVAAPVRGSAAAPAAGSASQ